MADGRLISHFFFTLTVDRCSVLPCTRKIVESHEYKERKKERERESLRNPIYPQDYPILFIQSISNAVRSTVTDCGKDHARSGRGKRERGRRIEDCWGLKDWRLGSVERDGYMQFYESTGKGFILFPPRPFPRTPPESPKATQIRFDQVAGI